MDNSVTNDDVKESLEEAAKIFIEKANEINDNLSNIESNTIDINENVEELLVISNPDYEEKEEKEEEKEEAKKEISIKSDQQEEEEEISISDIYTEIQETNSLLNYQNNLITVGVFSQGIIIGVLILTLFWNRFIR